MNSIRSLFVGSIALLISIIAPDRSPAQTILWETLGDYSIHNGVISGVDGLIKTGGGTIFLNNGTNDYSGATVIENGSLVIRNPGALGSSPSPVLVTESNPSDGSALTVGYFGGTLVLDGSGGGFEFSRDLHLQGGGPINPRSAALISIGDNVVSGQVVMAAGDFPRNTRLFSNDGLLTLSGGLVINGAPNSTFSTLGGTNTAGSGGSYAITGPISGTGTLEKAGAGTLFLTPSDTTGFSGTVRISSSAAFGQSSVRIGSADVFGTSTSTGTASPIDMNGGILEVRSEGDIIIGKNMFQRSSSTVFAGPAAGGEGVNGTVSFGQLTSNANVNRSLTFNSRNGYGVTFTGNQTQSNSNANNTYSNNLGGTLRFTGDVWNNSNTGTRTLTFQGNGNTVIEGSLNPTDTGTKNLVKTGGGSLTIEGTATSLNGDVQISGGAIRITDFRSLNNNAGTINLTAAGSAAATGLIIGTGQTASAAGLVTDKVIDLGGTTGTRHLYANQTGANPVVINSDLSVSATGNVTLVLGGSSTADNRINGAIPDGGGTVSLQKIGSGTWTLAGENTYTGTTAIVDGTLRLQANAANTPILPGSSHVVFSNSNGFGGATLEFVGHAGTDSSQHLNHLQYTGGGASTLKITPGGAGGTASLTLGNLSTGTGGSLNIVGADFDDNRVTVSLVNGNPATDGILTRSVYWQGADFAYREGGVLRAPVYGPDTGTATSSSALTVDSHNEITGSFATDSITINTLKIAGPHHLTINAGETVGFHNFLAGVLATGGDSSISGGTLAPGGQALVVRVNEASDRLTIASVISGTAGFNKNGEGTLVLAAANNQGGQVTINEGTVQLSGVGRLGANNANLVIRQAGTLDLNGVTPTTHTNALTNAGVITNTSATAVTFTVGNNDGGGTSYGIIDETAGIINVTKTGNGNQNWFGLSTYTGTTTIGGSGMVNVDHLGDIGVAGGIGRGDNTDDASNAASLVFNGSTGGINYTGAIREGNLALGSRSTSTDRLFTMSGSGATLSSTVGNNNAIVWSNHGAIVHGTNADRTLVLTGGSSNDNTFNPQLTDSAGFVTSLTKTNTGQWNLGNANNTYTGTTEIARGVLALNHNGALPQNSPLLLGNDTEGVDRFGILQMSGVFERDLAAAPVAGQGTVTWGATTGTTGGGGFAAHAERLVVAIGGIDNPTALTWGQGGFVGSNVVPGNAQALRFGSASALADVDFRNAIDLAGAVRQIQVDTNANTGADYATMSGVLSGSGDSGLVKTGSGNLRLTGANTYEGTTQVSAGALSVTSLGDSSAPGPSSLGDSTNGNTDAGALLLGNGTTGTAALRYVGEGETSDRKIRLNNTTGSSQIHADGAGALVLTNVANDLVAGAKSLYLRGTNTAGNRVSSQLSDNGGALGIIVDGSATWILDNGANDYSGVTRVAAGALGIGHDKALGNSSLLMESGSLFAYDGDRSLGNAVSQINGSTVGILGDHSLEFTGTYALGVSTGSISLNNTLSDGKTLTLNEVTADAMTADRTWFVGGPGHTVVAGAITTTAHSLNLTLRTGAEMTLMGENTGIGNVSVIENSLLRLDYSGGDTSRLSGSGTLTLGSTLSGGHVELSGGSHLEQVASTNLIAGSASTISRSSGDSVLALGAITAGAGSSLNIFGNDIASTTNDNVGGILGGWATVTIGGDTSWAVNSGVSDGGSGGLIRAFDDFANVTARDSGNKTIGNDANSNVRIVEGTGVLGGIGLAAAITTVNSIKAENTSAATIDLDQDGNALRIGNQASDSGAIWLQAGSGGLTIAGGNLSTGGTANGTADTLVILQESSTGALTINSNLVNNGTDALGLSKQGEGLLVLGGTNTYTGDTVINQGEVRGGIGGGNVVVNATSPGEAFLNLNGADATIGTLVFGGTGGTSGSVNKVDTGGGTLTLGGTVTVSAIGHWTESAVLAGNVILGTSGTRTFTVNDSLGADVDLRVDAVLSGGTALAKGGTGTLFLAHAANTFTGQMQINSGTTQVTTLADTHTASSIGTGSSNSILRIGNATSTGTLEYLGDTNSSTNRRVQIGAGTATTSTGGATILNNGLGTLAFSDTAFFNQLSNTADNDPGAGRTLTLGGSNTGDNLIAGTIRDNSGSTNPTVNLLKGGEGTWILAGNNTYSGTTTISAGTLQLGNGGATGSLNTASTILNNGNFVIHRSNTVEQGVDFSASGISGSGNLIQAGTGTTILNANNTYTGATLVTGGQLVVSDTGSISGTSGVVVSGSDSRLIVNGTLSAGSGVTLEDGAFLGGSGNLGDVTFDTGSVVSPGNSIGTLNVGNTIWNGGSTYEFEFSGTDGSGGVAGTDWDLLNIAGTLDLSGASSANRITIDLVTMEDATTPGFLPALTNWDPLQNAVWSGFVQTTGGIIGFSSSKFDFNLDGFDNPDNKPMSFFSVVQNGNNLDLVYTAVPEPGTAGVLFGGLCAIMLRRRRRAIATETE